MAHKEKKEQEVSAQGAIVRELIAHFTSDLLIGKKFKNGEKDVE